MRLVLASLALALTAASADAGPIRDRLRARFGRPACSSGQCQPAVSFPAPAAVAYPTQVGGCAGGVCYPAAPAAFPAVFPSACPGGVCPLPARR